MLQKLSEKLIAIKTHNQLQQVIEAHLQKLIQNSTEYAHFKHFTLFAGLLPSTWKIKFDQTTDREKYTQWAMSIGNWLIQKGMEVWTTRNKQFNEKSTKQSIVHRLLDEKIEHLYTLQYDVNNHDKNIFNTPIEERLAMTEKQKQKWIEETNKTIYRCINDHQQKMQEGQRDIRTFFGKPEKSQ